MHLCIRSLDMRTVMSMLKEDQREPSGESRGALRIQQIKSSKDTNSKRGAEDGGQPSEQW